MNVAITGGTGHIGSVLGQRLRAAGHGVRTLGRRSPPADFAWDVVNQAPPAAALQDVDAVVHLAGEPVAQRWTAEVKERIWNSRVSGTRRLVDALGHMDRKPRVLVSASGVGYYGNRGDEPLTEASQPGDDFLADLAQAWEREALWAAEAAVRVVPLRIGVVLSPQGGALQQMLTPFKLGIGGRLGSGKQWMSWIHVEDLVSLIILALQSEALRGPVNAVSPTPARNAEFTKALGRAIHRPTLFPVPKLALQTLYGEMAEVLLGGQRVVPEVAQGAGFDWRFPTLDAALRDLV